MTLIIMDEFFMDKIEERKEKMRIKKEKMRLILVDELK